MFVSDHDHKPTTLLAPSELTVGSWIGGILSTLGAHGLVIGAAIVASATNILTDDEPQSYIEEHVVEARFVQLGKPPDPRKLPQRKVPRKSTAPVDSVAVSKREDPPKPKKKKDKPPERAEEDLLTRLGDRAQTFAEIAEQREREGDPEGLEDGTETEAKEGDLYLGKLVAFLRRGWTIPTTLGDTKHLTARTTFEITRDLKVGPHRIVRSSGEPLFDQSVEDRYNQLRELGTTLPEPPPEVANQFLGQSITVRFNGKSAR